MIGRCWTVLRWSIFTLTVFFTVAWIAKGRSALQSLGTPGSKISQFVDGQIKTLRNEDPKAATALTKLRESMDERALAAVLKREAGFGGDAQVRHFAASPEVPATIRLVALAVNPNFNRDHEERERFLWAHATTLETLHAASTDPETIGIEYVNRLEKGAQYPGAWRLIRDNPLALLVWEAVGDTRKLWQYYEQNQDWLNEVVAEVGTTATELEGDVPAEAATPSVAVIRETIRIAEKYHPEFQLALNDEKGNPSVELAAETLSLFVEFGDLLVLLGKAPVPVSLTEALEVVFANRDFLGDELQHRKVAEVAASLALVRSQKRAVWLAARQSPIGFTAE